MKKYFGLILVLGGVVGLIAGSMIVSGGIELEESFGHKLKMPIGIGSIAFGAIFFYQGLRYMMTKSYHDRNIEE